jgi:hypothetical protein
MKEEVGVESLQHVQNDESLTTKLAFWIDTCSTHEVRQMLCAATAILIGLIYLGLNGNPSVITNASHRNFDNLTKEQTFYFDASPVAPQNRFIEFAFALMPAKAATAAPPITVSYKIATYNWTVISTRTDVQSATFTPKLNGDSTNRFSLLKDHAIDYTAIEVTLHFTSVPIEAYDGVTVYTTLGGRDLTYFQTFFRAIIGGFQIWALNKLTDEIDWFTYFSWPIILKLVFPAVFISLFANNPLWLFHSYKARGIMVFLELLFTPTLHSLVAFIILVLLDSIHRSENMLIALALPKLTIAAYKLVTGFLVAYNSVTSGFNHKDCESINSLGSFFGFLNFVANIALLSAGGYYVYRAHSHSAASNPLKWTADLSLGVMFLGYLFLIPIIGWIFGIYTNTGIEFVFEFSVYNALVALVLILHWPCGAGDMVLADLDNQFAKPEDQLSTRVEEIVEVNENWNQHPSQEEMEPEEEEEETDKSSQ